MEIIDVTQNPTTSARFYESHFWNCLVLNELIPISKHYEVFSALYPHAKEILKNESHQIQFDSFSKLNDEILDTLSEIESNGIHIDRQKFISRFGEDHAYLIGQGDLVYSQYTVFTSTGRPSNKFGNINFAALNKEDETRLSFNSRFGESGMLVDMDFTAFHPHLIATLINYDLDPEVDIYAYLSKFYKVTPKESKVLTFRQLYGGVESKYSDIPYFKKWKRYVDQRYEFFKSHGYVETPIYNRPITKLAMGSDANPSKIGSYILQAMETEVALNTASRVLEFLRDGKKSKLVLYTYDSMLFDFHRDDGLQALQEIKKIMINGGKYPIKIKVGNTYKNLREFNL
jgi:hypothetical protein